MPFFRNVVYIINEKTFLKIILYINHIYIYIYIYIYSIYNKWDNILHSRLTIQLLINH